MGKKGLVLRGDEQGAFSREWYLQFYRNKYFNLWMTRYKWTGLDAQQVNFIMRKFWSPEGTVAAFRIKGTEGMEGMPDIACGFAPYAPSRWNIYDFAIAATLINKRGVKFIPMGEQIIGKDIVVGFCQQNHKGIFPMADQFFQKIAEAESALALNVAAAKMPYLIATTPETEDKMSKLFDKIAKGDPALYVSADEIEKIKILDSGASYIVDKLYSYIQAQETALREFLGFDNTGVMEKKEHLITSEVDSNNDVTDQSSDSFLSCMKEFAQQITDVLKIPVSVELNEETPPQEQDEEEQEVQEDEEI